MSVSNDIHSVDDGGTATDLDVDPDDRTQQVNITDGDDQTQLMQNTGVSNILLGPFPSFGGTIGSTVKSPVSTNSSLLSGKSSTRTHKDDSVESGGSRSRRISLPTIKDGSNNTDQTSEKYALQTASISSDEPIGFHSPMIPKDGIEGVGRYRRYSGPIPISPIRGDAANAIAALNSSPDGYDSDRDNTMLVGDRLIGSVGRYLGREVVDSQATQLVNDIANGSSSPLFDKRVHQNNGDSSPLSPSVDVGILDFDHLASSPIKKDGDDTNIPDDVSDGDDHDDHIRSTFLALEDSQLHKRRRAIMKLKQEAGTAIQVDEAEIVHLNLGESTTEGKKREEINDTNDYDNENNEKMEIQKYPSSIKNKTNDFNDSDVDPSPSHISDSVQGSEGGVATQIISEVRFSQMTLTTATSSQFQETQKVRLPIGIPTGLLVSRSEWMESKVEVGGGDVFNHPASLGSQNSNMSQPAVTQVLGTPRHEMGERTKSMRVSSTASSAGSEGEGGNEEAITSDHEDKINGEEEVVGEKVNEEEIIVSSPENYETKTPTRRGGGDDHSMTDDDDFVLATPVNTRKDIPTPPDFSVPEVVARKSKKPRLIKTASNAKEEDTEKIELVENKEKETDESSEDEIIPSKRKANGKLIRNIPPLTQSSPPPISPIHPPESTVWGIWNKQTWHAVKLLDNISVASLFGDNANKSSPPTDSLNVMFTNGDVTELTVDKICRFDLQIGDKVKLDDDRRPNFEILELFSHPPADYVDIQPLKPEKQWVGREGVQFVKLKHSKTSEERIAPIHLLYMNTAQSRGYLGRRHLHKNTLDNPTVVLPPSFQSDAFKLNNKPNKSSKITTPVPNLFVPTDKTIITTQVKIESTIPTSRGIFSDCVFTISAIDNNKELESLTNTIVKNGGLVLNGGLQELFDVNYSLLEMKYSNPAKLTFGGVLAKIAVRTPKYLEGLALGWPCLSFKFIIDSISDGELIRDWEPYLLSSGISNVLDQVHCSYNISLFHQNWLHGAFLSDQFMNRKHILGSILADNIYLYNHDPKDNAILFLLMTMTPPNKLCLVSSRNDVPNGSILVDISRKSPPTSQSITPRPQLGQLRTSKSHPHTITYNREWLIQCLINQRMV